LFALEKPLSLVRLAESWTSNYWFFGLFEIQIFSKLKQKYLGKSKIFLMKRESNSEILKCLNYSCDIVIQKSWNRTWFTLFSTFFVPENFLSHESFWVSFDIWWVSRRQNWEFILENLQFLFGEVFCWKSIFQKVHRERKKIFCFYFPAGIKLL